MNRSPRELCRLLEAHHATQGACLRELRRASEQAVPERGGEDVQEDVWALKARIVVEANNIISLMSPG